MGCEMMGLEVGFVLECWLSLEGQKDPRLCRVRVNRLMVLRRQRGIQLSRKR